MTSKLVHLNSTTIHIHKSNGRKSNIFCPTGSCDDPNLTSPLPRLSYLVAYPHSGTTYFMEFIRNVTKMNTATNYAYNAFNESYTILSSENNADLGEEILASPFWSLNPQNIQWKIPKSYIITETYCTRYCTYPCSPSEFLQTPYTFEEGCRTIIVYTNKRKKQYQHLERIYI